MLIPSERHRRMAGSPSRVPGIFTMMFGRSIVPHSRRAASIVPSVSHARSGLTSTETNPSRPSLSS